MRSQPCILEALVLAVCAGTASAQDEDVVKKFERLGAIVKRDDTKPTRPVIALRFGLRNPIPDATSESAKDCILNNIFLSALYGGGAASYRPTDQDGLQKDGGKPIDPSTPVAIKVTDADLENVSKLEYLQTLDVSCGGITNKALGHLQALKDLRTLDLRNTQVNDAGLALLEKLEKLKNLYLTNCPVTDDGLVHLRSLNLDVLHVGGLQCKVTDKGLRHLKEIKSLQKLYLQHALGLTDEGLKELKELTNLRELNLRNAKVTGEGLKHLSGLERLQMLDLSGKYLTDDALKHLAGFEKIEILDLSHNQITDEGLKHLAGLKRLEVLDLRYTAVTDEGMKTLQKLESLRRLSVGCTKVTDKGIKHLKGLKKLERLDLQGTQVTAAGVNEIREALPKLEVGEIMQLPDWFTDYLEQPDQMLKSRFEKRFQALVTASPPVMPVLPRSEESHTPSWPGSLGWLCPVIAMILLAGAASARGRSGSRNS